MGSGMSEWTRYGITSASNGRIKGGSILEDVYHVVHAPTARRILEDGRLEARIVNDDSRLRKSRIAVTWLSANTWAHGSIYGNVQFSFPWAKQIDGLRFYWVEAMTRYEPHAYRILLTDRDLSESKLVQEYDPYSDKGPLRERDGVWYWNDQYTSEFMVEGDISLEDCTDLNFISHHNSICRPHGIACRNQKVLPCQTAGWVLASILGQGIHSIDHVLKKPSPSDQHRRLSPAVDLGINGITHALGGKRDRFGGAIKSRRSAEAVMRGALTLYGTGGVKWPQELIKLLKSQKIFDAALTEMVNDHFKITGWTIED